MSRTCEECGGDVTAKNSAGHYRAKCRECIEQVAATADIERPPCEATGCDRTAIGPNGNGKWLCGVCMADAYVRQ